MPRVFVVRSPQILAARGLVLPLRPPISSNCLLFKGSESLQKIHESSPSDTIILWPKGAPTRLGDVPPETEFRGLQGVSAGTVMLRNVSEPTLTVFRPLAEANGIGVIVCPGGGWRILAWEHEGIDVARWLAA